MSKYSFNGSVALIERLKSRIGASPVRSISFRDFMEMCLYEPGLGYYKSLKPKIGKEGDFYTSSNIGSIMGEILAVFLLKQMEHMSDPVHLVEWGGGSGALAKDVLDELKRLSPDHYRRIRFIEIEQSEAHQALILAELSEHAGMLEFMTPEDWFQGGSRTNTIIYSNELLDAFPVHRIVMKQGTYYEVFVEWNETDKCFQETLLPMKDGTLQRHMDEHGIRLAEGQRAEVNLEAADWIEKIGAWLTDGVVVTIDYGDCAEELYGENRMLGTLVCYRDHQAYDNPYVHIGEQDITSHVDFTACVKAGERAGMETVSYVSQKRFLIENGIFERLQNVLATDPFSPEARKNRAIRQLLLSDQMSELFKVLVQRKGKST